jgi:hypothetical protein
MSRGLAGVCALIAALVLAAGALGAFNQWSRQHTPSPAGARSSSLASVSCTTSCIAVGAYQHSGKRTFALAERWDRKRWLLERTARPRGATGTALRGVSCVSPRACTAVGYYLGGTGNEHALTERWNGKRWSIERGPVIRGRLSYLASVSCTSRTACLAVGSSTNGAQTRTVALAERFNGKRWSLERPANPPGASHTYLEGVWCTWRTVCMAVGHYKTRAGVVRGLAERRKGPTWLPARRQARPSSAATYLRSVSCPFSSGCTAVGYFKSQGGKYLPLAGRWNGRRWFFQRPQNSARALSTHLDGVSCNSAIACTAVGYFVGRTGERVTVAERWNGKKWSLQHPPDPGGAHGAYLDAVACSSSTACTAAGSYSNGARIAVTLAERWHPGR